MKFELREGTFRVMPKHTIHLITDLYCIGRNERYGISLECMTQDYEDDNFVQNLRSRSLNHNNITPTIEDLGYDYKYYRSLECKRRKTSNSYTLKAQCERR